MKICGFLEWPDGQEPSGQLWDALRRQVEAAAPDILVTNEMPFGPWLAAASSFDYDEAMRSVELHEAALDALASLGIPAVISSRPVWSGGRLANEAFALEGGRSRPLHRKRFFPQEAGWFEASWFEGGARQSEVHEVNGISVGVLLCTDLMFNEQARSYGRQGADLIAVPRAAGRAYNNWTTAGGMAAIVSGSYVVSSNRVGRAGPGPTFGGLGFAFSPDGTLIATTSSEAPLMIVEVDVAWAQRQKREYPCYVAGAPEIE